MRIIVAILTSVMLTSCANDSAERMQKGGVKSVDLYGNADKRVNAELDVRRVRHMIARDTQYEPYTRTAMNETDILFKLLPNPKISLFIYPHISTRDNAPVPGYTTAVSLYERDEYALPTEELAQGLQRPLQ